MLDRKDRFGTFNVDYKRSDIFGISKVKKTQGRRRKRRLLFEEEAKKGTRGIRETRRHSGNKYQLCVIHKCVSVPEDLFVFM